MNLLKTSCFIVLLQTSLAFTAHAQFGGLKDKLISAGSAVASKALGVDKILKQPAAITTSFEDVDKTGSKLPDFKANEKAQPLYLLPKAPDGGYVLCEGFLRNDYQKLLLDGWNFCPF